jgi:hypothetical protein
MIASISLDHALILWYRANPAGSNFRERQRVPKEFASGGFLEYSHFGMIELTFNIGAASTEVRRSSESARVECLSFIWVEFALTSRSFIHNDFGLVNTPVADDPTLRPGDIVATNAGLMAYNAGPNGSTLVPISTMQDSQQTCGASSPKSRSHRPRRHLLAPPPLRQAETPPAGSSRQVGPQGLANLVFLTTNWHLPGPRMGGFKNFLKGAYEPIRSELLDCLSAPDHESTARVILLVARKP